MAKDYDSASFMVSLLLSQIRASAYGGCDDLCMQAKQMKEHQSSTLLFEVAHNAGPSESDTRLERSASSHRQPYLELVLANGGFYNFKAPTFFSYSTIY